MFGAVDLTRAQVGAQQLIFAEDVERQEAVVVVVAMEEAVLLIATHGDVSGIEIQDDALRWSLVRGNELINQELMHRPCGLPVAPLLETVQRGYAGESAVAFNRRLQRHITAQMLMVEQIPVAKAESIDSLAQQA